VFQKKLLKKEWLQQHWRGLFLHDHQALDKISIYEMEIKLPKYSLKVNCHKGWVILKYLNINSVIVTRRRYCKFSLFRDTRLRKIGQTDGSACTIGTGIAQSV
jgi:hypothetical protein